MQFQFRAALIAALLVASAATAQETPAPAAEATAPAAAPAAPTEADAQALLAQQEAQAQAQAQAFFDSLTRQTGPITIAGGKVQLTVPDTHYFVGPEDARRIIVDLWGNPPETGTVEGMIFPRDGNPAAGSWGAVVEYSAEGYVSDSDASTTDYAQLLRDMQNATGPENEARRNAGFPEVTLVGWAEQPHYDPLTHKIYWGKQLRFTGGQVDTLNYDIRVLGREGFLVVSFVATMPELQAIQQSTPAVLAMAEFTEGNRYADYQEGVDQRAAYGIGGLVAGGALAAVAQKTGLLALILAFGKKFIVLIGAGLMALFGAVTRMFKKKDDGANNDGGGAA